METWKIAGGEMGKCHLECGDIGASLKAEEETPKRAGRPGRCGRYWDCSPGEGRVGGRKNSPREEGGPCMVLSRADKCWRTREAPGA